MSVLTTGTGALLAFQRALGTVSHNVANVNTEGYSRQRVEFATRNPSPYGFGYVGNGVKIADIHRIADQLATSRLLDSGGELARLQQLQDLSGRVDLLFSDNATGLSGMWSKFFDSVTALSANAAGTAERQDLLAMGKSLATRFHQLDGQLQTLEGEVNNRLLSGASEINRLAAEIAQINRSVANARTPSSDLLDRRDHLIGQLIGFTGGSMVVEEGGMANVFSAGGQALVVGVHASTLTTVQDPYRPERLQLALQTQGTSVTLDQRSLGGQMGGLLEFRSTVLEPAQGELGRITLALAQTFNAGHRGGVDLYGDMGGDFFSVPAPRVTGHSANTSTASLTASVADISALDTLNVVLRFDGAGWTATRADTGAAVTVTGTGAAGDPLRVGGIALEVSTAPPPAAGDRFLLSPTAGAAAGIGVAITDPSRIAAALPVSASSDLQNLGSGVLSGLKVDDAGNGDLLTDVTIEFIDAGQYMVGTDGPFAFTSGQTISANGWTITLGGAPAAGDQFHVSATRPGSGDNGNALTLSNLDDARALNGGTVSLNGAIGGLTTLVGSAARQAEYSSQAQQVLYDQALAARESVSGVNLDEEAANMLRLQQAYQAAAQIISTADNMFQSILAAVR
jgi:flagellar hook-associated protein 1 FlgK